MNRLEELGRVDSEKAYTKKGKRNLADEKSSETLIFAGIEMAEWLAYLAEAKVKLCLEEIKKLISANEYFWNSFKRIWYA